VVRVLDENFDGSEFDSRPRRLVLGWVTVCRQANHVSTSVGWLRFSVPFQHKYGYISETNLSTSLSHLGQLSLLPYAGREMSTSQSAMMFCGWGVKAGMVHSTCGKRDVGGR